MMKFISFLIGLLCLCPILGAQPVTTYHLDEVVVAGEVPWKKVLRKTIDKLSKIYAGDTYIHYGNGRYSQACYLGDQLVLTCDVYGWYEIWGWKNPDNLVEACWYFPADETHFNPVYHNTEVDSHQAGYIAPNQEVAVKCYIAEWLYEQNYMFLPCFYPARFYEFSLDGYDGQYYFIRFRTAEKYFPDKIPISSDGVLIIDGDDAELKTIQMEHVISCTNPIVIGGPHDRSGYKEQAYTEELTIHFSHGGIITDMLHSIVWKQEENPEKGVLSKPLPLQNGLEYKVPCTVKESWKAENCIASNYKSFKKLCDSAHVASSDLKMHNYRSKLAPDFMRRLDKLNEDNAQAEKIANAIKIPYIQLFIPTNKGDVYWTLPDKVISSWQPILFREP